MKVFVTGASGFLGRHLVPALLGAGHEVAVLVRGAAPPPGATGGRLLTIRGSLDDEAALAAGCRGADAVVHMAYASGIADPALLLKANVEGSTRLIAAAKAAKVGRFVFTSSISANRERLGPYGAGKRVVEERLRESGLPFVIVRPSLVYGDLGIGLVASLVAYLRSLPAVPVIGNGRIELDPIHVDDVSAAILQCLTRNDVLGHSYDLLGPDRVTFDQLLERIAAEIGVSRPLVHIPGWLALLMARVLALVTKRPPVTVDNVLGMISPARVDRESGRVFTIRWTPLAEGLPAMLRPGGAAGAAAPATGAAGAEPGPSRPVRVAVVGLGKMGVVHSAVLSMIERAELVGLVDRSPAFARTLKGMGFTAPVYPTLAEMLRAARPEAVWVCTPPDSHLAIARECVAAGASVLVEKPLAHTLESAVALAALGDGRPGGTPGPRIGCGYGQVYMPTFAAARGALAEGAIGRLKRVSAAMYLSQVFAAQRGWMYDAGRSGGGVVANLTTHLLSVLQVYFGLPTSVRATWKKLYGSVEDEVHARYTLPGGIEMEVESSWSVPGYPISFTTITAEGENGTLRVSNEVVELNLVRAAAGRPAGVSLVRHSELPQSARFDLNGEVFYLEDARFLAWVTGGPVPANTAEAALDVQRMAAALYESAAAEGRAVEIVR